MIQVRCQWCGHTWDIENFEDEEKIECPECSLLSTPKEAEDFAKDDWG